MYSSEKVGAPVNFSFTLDTPSQSITETNEQIDVINKISRLSLSPKNENYQNLKVEAINCKYDKENYKKKCIEVISDAIDKKNLVVLLEMGWLHPDLAFNPRAIYPTRLLYASYLGIQNYPQKCIDEIHSELQKHFSENHSIDITYGAIEGGSLVILNY